MEYRSSEIKAGAFIFFAGLGLIAAVFTLGDIKDYFKPRKEVKILFRFAGGLEQGAPVSYAGLQVGRVKQIKLINVGAGEGKDQISVLAEIDPMVQLKKDSAAAIKTSGLMGGFYIDIRPGSSVSEPLGKSDALIGHESFEIAKVGDMMTEVVMQVRRFTDLTETLVGETQATMRLAQATLNDMDDIIQENKRSVKANVSNLGKLTSRLNRFVEENEPVLQESLGHMSSAMERGDRLLKEKGGQIENIIAQVDHVSRELEILLADTRPELTSLVRDLEKGTKEITASIDTVAGNLDTSLRQGNEVIVENRRNLLQLVKNLKETSDNLKDLSGDIKRNPWKLVRKEDEEPAPVDQVKAPRPFKKELRMKRLDKVANP